MKITKLLNRTLVVAAMLVCSSCKPTGGDDPQPIGRNLPADPYHGEPGGDVAEKAQSAQDQRQVRGHHPPQRDLRPAAERRLDRRP